MKGVQSNEKKMFGLDTGDLQITGINKISNIVYSVNQDQMAPRVTDLHHLLVCQGCQYLGHFHGQKIDNSAQEYCNYCYHSLE